MSRCVICDHEDGYANSFLHRPQNNGNRVRLRPHPQHEGFKEYVCDECHASYKYAVQDLEPFTEITDTEETPAVSLREFV